MLLQNSKNKEWSKQLKTTAQARKNTEYCIQGVQTERLNQLQGKMNNPEQRSRRGTKQVTPKWRLFK